LNTVQTPAFRFGAAWATLCLCFALHVVDEALTGFLGVYNPTVRALRGRFPFLPLPAFTFKAWLAGLILAIVVLAALSLPAFRGLRWMTPLAYGFGMVMLANGLGHIGGSIYMRRWMPGAYTSPLLLAGSCFLLASARSLRAALNRASESCRPRLDNGA
jgi:hypothetical protein